MNNKRTVHFKGVDSVRVLPVIETRTPIGTGTYTDLSRQLIQYWDLEGRLLAEYDPCSTNFERQVDV